MCVEPRYYLNTIPQTLDLQQQSPYTHTLNEGTTKKLLPKLNLYLPTPCNEGFFFFKHLRSDSKAHADLIVPHGARNVAAIQVLLER